MYTRIFWEVRRHFVSLHDKSFEWIFGSDTSGSSVGVSVRTMVTVMEWNFIWERLPDSMNRSHRKDLLLTGGRLLSEGWFRSSGYLIGVVTTEESHERWDRVSLTEVCLEKVDRNGWLTLFVRRGREFSTPVPLGTVRKVWGNGHRHRRTRTRSLPGSSVGWISVSWVYFVTLRFRLQSYGGWRSKGYWWSFRVVFVVITSVSYH